MIWKVKLLVGLQLIACASAVTDTRRLVRSVRSDHGGGLHTDKQSSIRHHDQVSMDVDAYGTISRSGDRSQPISEPQQIPAPHIDPPRPTLASTGAVPFELDERFEYLEGEPVEHVRGEEVGPDSMADIAADEEALRWLSDPASARDIASFKHDVELHYQAMEVADFEARREEENYKWDPMDMFDDPAGPGQPKRKAVGYSKVLQEAQQWKKMTEDAYNDMLANPEKVTKHPRQSKTVQQVSLAADESSAYDDVFEDLNETAPPLVPSNQMNCTSNDWKIPDPYCSVGKGLFGWHTHRPHNGKDVQDAEACYQKIIRDDRCVGDYFSYRPDKNRECRCNRMYEGTKSSGKWSRVVRRHTGGEGNGGNGDYNSYLVKNYKVSARVATTEKIRENVWCNTRKEGLGRYDTPEECGIVALNTYWRNNFMYGECKHNNKRCNCWASWSTDKECTSHMKGKNNVDFYFVHDPNSPVLSEVTPREGSVAGGQVITIRGYGVLSDHSTMHGTEAGSSDRLAAEVEVKFVEPRTLDVIDCPLVFFTSGSTAVKCTTPSIMHQKNLTNIWLMVVIYKNGVLVELPHREQQNKFRYRFSYGVTPQIEKVSPLAVGVGRLLTLQAWSCTGLVETEPVSLVSAHELSPEDSAVSADQDELGDGNTSWSHACEPYPSFENRNAPADTSSDDNEQAELTQGGEFSMGERGMDVELHELDYFDIPDTSHEIQEFLRLHTALKATHHFIASDGPMLHWKKFWRTDNTPYVAKVSGFLQIEKGGQYEFRIYAERAAYMKFFQETTEFVSDNKLKTTGTRHKGGLYSRAYSFDPGWAKLEIGHSGGHRNHHSELKIWYKGPDTKDGNNEQKWRHLPADKLRSLHSLKDVEEMNKRSKNGEKIVPAETVKGHRLKPPVGMMRCPNSGQDAKLVQWRCRVHGDMKPGFYDIEFKDAYFGKGLSDRARRHTGIGNIKAALQVVPAIDTVTIDKATNHLSITGSGLDAESITDKNNIISYGSNKYNILHSTQNHIDLKPDAQTATAVPTTIGARGLLRETWKTKELREAWKDEAWPSKLVDDGKVPKIERASRLRTSIPEDATAGFSERLSGFFTPPYTGSCRFRLQGTQRGHKETLNLASLFVSTTPESAQGGDADTAAASDSIEARLIRPGTKCKHPDSYHCKHFSTVTECAGWVDRQGYSTYFVYEANHQTGKTPKCCTLGRKKEEKPIICNPGGLWVDRHWNWWQVEQHGTPKIGVVSVPSHPAVTTDYANLKSSAWMDFEANKPYALKLERMVAGRSRSTGVGGYEQLGLECRSLSDPNAMPKGMYTVMMKMKEFPVTLTLPKSSKDYTLAYSANGHTRSARVTKDKEVGQGVMSLLGGTCKTKSEDPPTKVLNDFERLPPTSSAHCGTGAWSPDLSADGTWTHGTALIAGVGSTGEYELQTLQHLHMCYNIPPDAKVTMIIKCRVGHRNRHDWFSVVMTDPNQQMFSHGREFAAVFAKKLTSVENADPIKNTRGQWHCGSFNLFQQVVGSPSLVGQPNMKVKKFRDTDYKGNPSSMLEHMKITEIYLGSAVRHGHSWTYNTGKTQVDMLVAHTGGFEITDHKPSIVTSYPFSRVLGASTSSGWKVDWIKGDKSWLGNEDGEPQHVLESTTEARLIFENHRRGSNWGYIATGTIQLPESGNLVWEYKIDDIFYVWIMKEDGSPLSGAQRMRFKCCNRNWKRANADVHVSAGRYKVKVHFWQYGGGEYSSLRWSIDGSSQTYTDAVVTSRGVTTDHTLTFFPKSRSQFNSLKNMLSQIRITGGDNGVSNNYPEVREPHGQPASETVNVVSLVEDWDVRGMPGHCTDAAGKKKHDGETSCSGSCQSARACRESCLLIDKCDAVAWEGRNKKCHRYTEPYEYTKSDEKNGHLTCFVRKGQASGGLTQWTPAVVAEYGNDVPVDVGKNKFNALFALCPVVRYVRDGRVHSIYVRESKIPSGFDAHSHFTAHWHETDNKMGTDFNLYSTIDDIANKNVWKYCKFHRGVGYPGTCGKKNAQPDQWFRMPGRGGPKRVSKASLELLTNGHCLSEHGSRTSKTGAASFNMGDSEDAIANKLAAGGINGRIVKVVGKGGLKWLDLHQDGAAYAVGIDGNRKAENAIDGMGLQACKHNHNLVACTSKAKNAWMTFRLGGEFDVKVVRITSAYRDMREVKFLVDGIQCATFDRIRQWEVHEIPCFAHGGELTMVTYRNEQVALCEVEVGVQDTSPAALDPNTHVELETFAIHVANEESGFQPKLKFSSPLASEVLVKEAASGNRYWGDLSDFWFRMPHAETQVQLGNWRSFIAEDAQWGTHPIDPSKNETSAASLLAKQLSTHFSVLERARRSSSTVRRDPPKRWRLAPRYHTEETLEALRRRVLGFADKPNGWTETAALLKVHGDHAEHMKRKKAADSEGTDPRDLNECSGGSQSNCALVWSHESSWGNEPPPTAETTDIVYLPEGKTALLDIDANLNYWVIEGALVWKTDVNINMGAHAIIVNGGKFLIGKETAPYSAIGLITLYGHWHTKKLPLCGTKTIFQTAGVVEMHGKPKTPTWVELEQTADSNQPELKLRSAVANWNKDDEIVIAGTDAYSVDCRLDRQDDCQTEKMVIEQVSADGKTITLNGNLKYRHLAEELDSLFDASHCAADPHHESCAKTQIRAEVGVLTRNLKIKGSNDQDGTGEHGTEGYGAHLMHGQKAIYTYVELFWAGQAFQMGRYPLHLHLTGVNSESKFVGCAVQHSFNRGITVHGTHQATIKDNVVYNTMAHNYFIEDGNEHDNLFEHNLGVMTHISLSLLVSDQTPATFWIRNPQNTFKDNHAAGSAAFGFWFDLAMEAINVNGLTFVNNVAHNNGNTGVWIDNMDPKSTLTSTSQPCSSPDTWTITLDVTDATQIDKPVNNNAPECAGYRLKAYIESTTTWANQVNGIMLFETGHLNIINHRSVSDINSIVVWGVASDHWPDESNGWNGPTIANSSYRTTSSLPFQTSCGVGGPWDDTLFVTGMHFHGIFTRATFCPCFHCIAAEGGYETRTSKLHWHGGAGTAESPVLSCPWMHSTDFYDFDGTFSYGASDGDSFFEGTEILKRSLGCNGNGCYVACGMNRNAGRYTGGSSSLAQVSASARAGSDIEEGGTAYLDSAGCVADPMVGVVCKGSINLEGFIITDIGAFHSRQTVDVVTSHGYVSMSWVSCYQQYEVYVQSNGQVDGNARMIIVPPMTSKTMWDIYVLAFEAKLTDSENWVLQFEVIHAAGGYSAVMNGASHNGSTMDAPVSLEEWSLSSEALKAIGMQTTQAMIVNRVEQTYSMHTAVDQAMYPQINNANGAMMWGALDPLGASGNADSGDFVIGLTEVFICRNGVGNSANLRGEEFAGIHQPQEGRTTLMLNENEDAAKGGGSFSLMAVSGGTTRIDSMINPETGHEEFWEGTRLKSYKSFCGLEPGGFRYHPNGFDNTNDMKTHFESVHGMTEGTSGSANSYNAPQAFKWSEPATGWVPPEDDADVKIEGNWEVTLDKDVTVRKLNIMGVLKFEDKLGCCILTATYIFVGPYFGRLQVGTEDTPFNHGPAKIILKGHPGTTHEENIKPQIMGSASFLRSKYIAVQGTLLLHGKAPASTWAKLQSSASAGATTLTVEDSATWFKPGDTITIHEGEKHKITAVSGTTLTLEEPLQRSYAGLDDSHLNYPALKGKTAAAVGLLDGTDLGHFNIKIQGADDAWSFLRLCGPNCPYGGALPKGYTLSKFAEKTDIPASCVPCSAIRESDFSGWIGALAYLAENKACPTDHGVIRVHGVAFDHAANMALYHPYSGYNFPGDVEEFPSLPAKWSQRGSNWWTDGIWTELQQGGTSLGALSAPQHKITSCAFNNEYCGAAFAAATSGVSAVGAEPFENNVFHKGGVGLNGAARNYKDIKLNVNAIYEEDKFGKQKDDMWRTATMGVGNPQDEGEEISKKGAGNAQDADRQDFEFRNNFLSGAPISVLLGAKAHDNYIMGPVWLDANPIANDQGTFVKNTVSSTHPLSCIRVWHLTNNHLDQDNGIQDNVVFGCVRAVTWAGMSFNPKPAVKDMTIIDSDYGIYFQPLGPHAKNHDMRQSTLKIEDTEIYAKSDGGGVGVLNPKLRAGPLGNQLPLPDWFQMSPNFFPMGHGGISLYFKSQLSRVKLAGYTQKAAIQVGGDFVGGDPTDNDFHPIFLDTVTFPDSTAKVKFADNTAGYGLDKLQCIQIDCDGRRNSLIVDETGGLVGGSGGTVIPKPRKFYDKLAYKDPLGFETIEDLIPFPARYDADGKAIPYPEGVVSGSSDHSQHAKKFGRVAKDAFGACTGTDGTSSAGKCTTNNKLKGPVYSEAGIYRSSACSEVSGITEAVTCPGGKHRHLLIEVMDWNHMTRRWAPVSVEVNDNLEAPQGGFLNILGGQPMFWTAPMQRVQTFHALGHIGLRHNVYFSGDPPRHMRFHLQYAANDNDGILLCMYYGLPNNIAGYVDGGTRVTPNSAWIPSASVDEASQTINFVPSQLTMLNPATHNHGDHYYDRMGIETGRPGYLYAVIKGINKYMDFKITHKVVLSTSLSVDADWNPSSWHNENSNHFYKKGINGLLRNLALLLGIPPTRIKVLGGRDLKFTSQGGIPQMTYKDGGTLLTEMHNVSDDSNEKHDLLKKRRMSSFLEQFDLSRRALAQKAIEKADPMIEHRHMFTHTELQAIVGQRNIEELAVRGKHAEAQLNRLRSLASGNAQNGFTLVVDSAPDPCQCCTGGNADGPETCDANERLNDKAGARKSATEAQVLINGTGGFANQNHASNGGGLAQTGTHGVFENATSDSSPGSVQQKYVPPGWQCNDKMYNDSECDCGCGTWDIDCDNTSLKGKVAVIKTPEDDGNGFDLEVLDQKQFKAFMSFVDSRGKNIIEGGDFARVKFELQQGWYTTLHSFGAKIVLAQNPAIKLANIENYWKGDFASELTASSSSSCSTAPNNTATETYEPICVKLPPVTVWGAVASQSQGRCARLPIKKEGSQCGTDYMTSQGHSFLSQGGDDLDLQSQKVVNSKPIKHPYEPIPNPCEKIFMDKKKNQTCEPDKGNSWLFRCLNETNEKAA